MCADGFTGDFCEFKTDQNELLYLNSNSEWRMNGFVFNDEGLITRKSVTFDDNVGAFHSCSTMLNGEAVIFGGSGNDINARQVTNSGW